MDGIVFAYKTNAGYIHITHTYILQTLIVCNKCWVLFVFIQKVGISVYVYNIVQCNVPDHQAYKK